MRFSRRARFSWGAGFRGYRRARGFPGGDPAGCHADRTGGGHGFGVSRFLRWQVFSGLVSGFFRERGFPIGAGFRGAFSIGGSLWRDHGGRFFGVRGFGVHWDEVFSDRGDFGWAGYQGGARFPVWQISGVAGLGNQGTGFRFQGSAPIGGSHLVSFRGCSAGCSARFSVRFLEPGIRYPEVNLACRVRHFEICTGNYDTVRSVSSPYRSTTNPPRLAPGRGDGSGAEVPGGDLGANVNAVELAAARRGVGRQPRLKPAESNAITAGGIRGGITGEV